MSCNVYAKKKEPHPFISPKPIICEDCGDGIKPNERRRKCKNCGKMVCGWCFNHVHN